MTFSARRRVALAGLFVVILIAAVAQAANQTPDVTPVHLGNSYPYQINVQPIDFGDTPLPTLHSYVAGTCDGKWVMLAGRTNGLHGFSGNPAISFPPSAQNQEIWVIDPVTKESWHRSLAGDPNLSAQQLAELTSANAQSAQSGNRLYMVGGYGAFGSTYQTFNELAAVDLPGIVNWVQTGSGNASDHIRTLHDDALRVTGGAMYKTEAGRMRLAFGQDFEGAYTGASSGIYTRQVRSFDIVDDGINLGISNLSSTAPEDAYRRRDLNVFPRLTRNPDSSLSHGLVALSGVFTDTNGAWTVPVEIDDSGQTTMANPASPGTFKQAMNNYESAKLGLYSRQGDVMHEVLFGGITLTYYNPATQTFVQDNNLPFTSQITQINVTGGGQYSQDLIGEFPANLVDANNNRLLYGANAQFFLADGVPTLDEDLIDLDALSAGGPTILGYIYGGLFSNAPNTRGVPGAVSGASNVVFQVVYTPVPEPGVCGVAGAALLLVARKRRRLRP